LTKALENNFDDVVSLFATNGTSPNGAVSLGMKGTGTQSGTYDVARSEDGSSYQIRKVGSSTWYSATSVSGDIIKFDDGPAKGLYLTIDTNSLAAGQSTTFTYSKGLGDTVKDMLDGLTDSDDGRISLRQKALQKDKEDLVDRIETLNERIEKYRAQLVKQYSAMEQALSTLKSQSSSISAFSDSSSSS
jgi:flagellar capping protein FliD